MFRPLARVRGSSGVGPVTDRTMAHAEVGELVEVVGTLWWLDRARAGAIPLVEQVPCLVRRACDRDSVARPISITVQFPSVEPLWVDSQLIVELPGWPVLRCVVAQQLSRVNRYRLCVIEEVDP